MRATLVLILSIAALAIAGESATGLFDGKSDSLFVLVFPNEKDEGESWADLEYHIQSALPKETAWRWVEVKRDRDAADWTRFNPRGNLMFQMRHRGRVLLQSDGVMMDTEVRPVLQAKGLIPPDPLIPGGFAATYRTADSAAGTRHEYEFLDSNFTLERESPREGHADWSGAYRMAIDTLKFHFKTSRRDGKEIAQQVRHACTFTWTRDTLTLLNPCPVLKDCDDTRRKSWRAIAGEAHAKSDKLILLRSR